MLECTLVLELVESSSSGSKMAKKSSDEDLNEAKDAAHFILDNIIRDVVAKKSQQKPVLVQPKKTINPRRDAFSRGGYVKRRRKPKVIQKSSSTESEDFTDSDGEISTYYCSQLPSSLQTLSQEVVSSILDEIITKVS